MEGMEKMKAEIFEEDKKVYKDIAKVMIQTDAKLSAAPEGVFIVLGGSEEYESRKDNPEAIFYTFEVEGKTFHVSFC